MCGSCIAFAKTGAYAGKGHCVLKKYGVLFLSVCLIMAGTVKTVFANTTQTEEAVQTAEAADPSIPGAWTGDGEDWQYLLEDGTYLERSWLYEGGRWYYLSGSGYMQTGIRKIGSDYYYFRENGAMATGWIYDYEEDRWYHAEEDGRLTRGWLYAGGAWYWFDSGCVMYNQGERMVSGHKYYFFEDGQMAADQYVGTYYYGADGLRARQYDITIKGKRKPDAAEKERITKAMAGVPREWIRKFHENGWELMFYTDKQFYSAPKTEQGIYYIYHKADTHYRKLKFTNPDTLAMAFGEYVAWATGNDADENQFMADYAQYLSESSLTFPLPSYFDDHSSLQFGHLFENWCRAEVRADMRKLSPALYQYMEETLGISREGGKPDLEELEEALEEEEGGSYGKAGPASDESLGKKNGPAGE